MFTELDAVTYLQPTLVVFVQMEKIISLKDWVKKFCAVHSFFRKQALFNTKYKHMQSGFTAL